MLWVDGEIITLDDLIAIEPELLAIARTEQLTLEGGTGLLRRARDGAQAILGNYMAFQGISTSDLSLRDVSRPGYLNDRSVQYAGFAQLVITGDTEDSWSPIKQWVSDRTLKLIYQTAANRNSDRYTSRYDLAVERIARESWPSLRSFGLPIVYVPIPAPGAVLERAGTFTDSNLSLVSGSGTLTDEVDVAITWTSAGSNGESYRSPIAQITLSSGQVLRVSISGLIPPDGTQPIHTQASSRYSTRVATGWNVYAGKRGGPLYLQNVNPIGLASTFTASGNLNYSGTKIGLGQYADVNYILETNLRRC